jgi:hypothetical protein
MWNELRDDTYELRFGVQSAFLYTAHRFSKQTKAGPSRYTCQVLVENIGARGRDKLSCNSSQGANFD